jgi:hypothetical protein
MSRETGLRGAEDEALRQLSQWKPAILLKTMAHIRCCVATARALVNALLVKNKTDQQVRPRIAMILKCFTVLDPRNN